MHPSLSISFKQLTSKKDPVTNHLVFLLHSSFYILVIWSACFIALIPPYLHHIFIKFQFIQDTSNDHPQCFLFVFKHVQGSRKPCRGRASWWCSLKSARFYMHERLRLKNCSNEYWWQASLVRQILGVLSPVSIFCTFGGDRTPRNTVARRTYAAF